ncbi:MAG TPA: outer membrane porin, OprD family [Gammaproteobacteria bacterium]|nr:outer membrane porin, OprD family [Gammaproteobacteria bacterium]
MEKVAGTRIRSSIASILLLTAQVACATPEYIQSEQTASGSVHEAVESTEHAFKLPTPVQVFSRLGDVFREGALDLQLRNYYFNRVRDDNPNLETWAQGGVLSYATPSWKNRLRLGATLYTSQKLYGPKDKDGAKLLKPGQDSFSVPGEAYLDARLYGNLSLRAYRQKFSLPYLNANDSRMVPNTFESVSLFDSSGERFVYGLAHTWRMKKRDATRFVSMTDAAGIDGPDRGVSTAAARYTFSNGANVGLTNHYGHDFMNIFYTELNSRARPMLGLGLHFSGQFTSQNSVGDELGGNFGTRTWGAKVAASYDGMVLNLAHTSTDSNTGIQSNWGGKPSYLSIMVKDFDRAGEDAWLVGLSTDFRFWGENAFSAFINYAWSDTPDDGSNASPDQSEFDLTFDYKPESGLVKGLWFRLRGAFVDQDGSGSTDLKDIRFIANYDFSIL